MPGWSGAKIKTNRQSARHKDVPFSPLLVRMVSPAEALTRAVVPARRSRKRSGTVAHNLDPDAKAEDAGATNAVAPASSLIHRRDAPRDSFR